MPSPTILDSPTTGLLTLTGDSSMNRAVIGTGGANSNSMSTCTLCGVTQSGYNPVCGGNDRCVIAWWFEDKLPPNSAMQPNLGDLVYRCTFSLQDVSQTAGVSVASDYESYGDNICQPQVNIGTATEFVVAMWCVASAVSICGWVGATDTPRKYQWNGTFYDTEPSVGTFNCTMSITQGSRGPGAAAAFEYEPPVVAGNMWLGMNFFKNLENYFKFPKWKQNNVPEWIFSPHIMPEPKFFSQVKQTYQEITGTSTKKIEEIPKWVFSPDILIPKGVW